MATVRASAGFGPNKMLLSMQEGREGKGRGGLWVWMCVDRERERLSTRGLPQGSKRGAFTE